MALDKFVPLSPDPDLNVGADMTLARFGHLNKLVEEINSGGGSGSAGIIVEGEGANSTIRCGLNNQAFGEYGSALSGLGNITCNDFTSSSFGRNNIAKGCYSSANGISNIVCSRNSYILSGTNNTIACDATQISCFLYPSYSGQYINNIVLPEGGGITYGEITDGACGGDFTSVWPAGSTFSATYVYAEGCAGTGSSCYSQFQMANVEVICSEYIAPITTRLYFCYDPTSPSFVGSHRPGTNSFGYLQKTGSFSDYSTYAAGYHPNVIAGGEFNTIKGFTSGATISGGYKNTISGGYATIMGGMYNSVYYGGDIIGGYNRSCQGYCTLIAGSSNSVHFSSSSFIAGSQNFACCYSSSSTITGYNNGISDNGNYSSIIGGCFNRICFSSSFSTIINSSNSLIQCSPSSVILGGNSASILGFSGSENNSILVSRLSCICVSNSYSDNSIIGGFRNCIIFPGSNTQILGGTCNIIAGCSSNTTIINGFCNTNCGSITSAIINSRCSIIPGDIYDATVIGVGITADRVCALHVNNLSIMNLPSSDVGLPSKSLWYDGATCTVKFVP